MKVKCNSHIEIEDGGRKETASVHVPTYQARFLCKMGDFLPREPKSLPAVL